MIYPYSKTGKPLDRLNFPISGGSKPAAVDYLLQILDGAISNINDEINPCHSWLYSRLNWTTQEHENGHPAPPPGFEPHTCELVLDVRDGTTLAKNATAAAAAAPQGAMSIDGTIFGSGAAAQGASATPTAAEVNATSFQTYAKRRSLRTDTRWWSPKRKGKKRKRLLGDSHSSYSSTAGASYPANYRPWRTKYHTPYVASFIQAKLDPDNPIYMRLPDELYTEEFRKLGLTEDIIGRKGDIFQLNSTIYGLKQSGAAWHELLKKDLLDLGFKQSTADECLFTMDDSSTGFTARIIMYVDDVLYCSNQPDKMDKILRVPDHTASLTKR